MILIDIEEIEQLLYVFLFGEDYLAGEGIPDHRYLLEEFHKIFEFHIAFVFGEDQPSQSCFFELTAFEDDAEVVKVVLPGDLAISIVINEVEDPAEEGILPAQQSQSSPKLLIVHRFLVMTQLMKPLADGLNFILAKTMLL